MAEPVSLAAGLALGVAGVFSSCLECFRLFHSSKGYSLHYQILITKLDVEKTRLLQWGTVVGLVRRSSRGEHPCLIDKTTGDTIVRILHCISSLLTDATKLREKYGLDEDFDFADNEPSGELDFVSRFRYRSFKDEHLRWLNRITQRQRQVTVATKTKWAIRDAEDFATLIKDLQDFVGNLFQIAQISTEVERLLVEQDVKIVSEDLGHLKLLDEACSGQNDDWSEAASVQVQASEMATQDRRAISEWIHEIVEDVPETNFGQEVSIEFSNASNAAVHSIPIRQSSPSPNAEEPALIDVSASSEDAVQRHQLPGKNPTLAMIEPPPEAQLLLFGFVPICRVTVPPTNREELFYCMTRCVPFLEGKLPDPFDYHGLKPRGDRISFQFKIRGMIVRVITADISAKEYKVNPALDSWRDALKGQMTCPAPDVAFGSHSASFAWSKKILSGPVQLEPILGLEDDLVGANFFLQFFFNQSHASARGVASVTSAMGAKGIAHLCRSDDRQKTLPSNAYSFSAFILESRLEILASYPVYDSAEYRYQIATWTLSTWDLAESWAEFVRGLTALRNLMNWSRIQRKEIIDRLKVSH